MDSRTDERQCGEFDRTDHLCADFRPASIRCRTLARWSALAESRELVSAEASTLSGCLTGTPEFLFLQANSVPSIPS